MKDYIIAMIRNQKLRPGDKIPSERELAKRFNIGRMTVRQGIMDLVNEGILRRVQGKGTFVAVKPIRQPLGRLMSFTEEIRELGYQPGAELIERKVIEADPEVALNLQIGERDKVLMAKRLRFVDGEIFSLNISYFPLERFPEIFKMDLSCLSIYEMIEERLGLRIKKAIQTLQATAATADTAKILEIKPKTPLLLLKRTTYVMNDLPIEFVRVFFLPDRYSFEIQLFK